ncbi:MAG: alpha/beta fold hydrolase [Pseudomonadota bacterium]
MSAPVAAPLRPRWSIEGRGWPMAEHSRFVTVRGLSWHVQVIEPERAGPPVDVLMLHGLGGAGHSWRGVAPLLAPHARIIVPDLPGHGFTGWPQGPGFALPGQARLMAALMAAIDARPVLGIGHSAGAPILARMALDGLAPIRAIVAFNGAFRRVPGAGGSSGGPAKHCAMAIHRVAAGPVTVRGTSATFRVWVTTWQKASAGPSMRSPDCGSPKDQASPDGAVSAR